MQTVVSMLLYDLLVRNFPVCREIWMMASDVATPEAMGLLEASRS
jgi:hypothetical protein